MPSHCAVSGSPQLVGRGAPGEGAAAAVGAAAARQPAIRAGGPMAAIAVQARITVDGLQRVGVCFERGGWLIAAKPSPPLHRPRQNSPDPGANRTAASTRFCKRSGAPARLGLARFAPKAWTQHPAPFARAMSTVPAIGSIGLEPWVFDSLTGSNSCLADGGSPAQPTIS
jgi:hypothetical protein